MGEVECTTGLCELWVVLGILSDGGWVPMAYSKVFWGSTGVWPDTLEGATIICDKVVEAVTSHHRSPGSTIGESQIGAAEQIPIRQYVTVSQEAKLFSCDIVNPRWKGNGGRCRMCVFVFWRAGSVVCVSKWVAIAWSKVWFAFCVFAILWEGRSIQVGWSQKSCVLYVDSAEFHYVRGATHWPASRDRYPIISHTRVGDRKPNLATSQLYN